ncbi:MAG: Zn-dependent hydrolase [Anaerolineae bacterium]|nr:Zn-dependent hydrolase [Anaerolineae bacterium]
MAYCTNLRIDERRFRTRFEALSGIAATPDGGVHRPALSAAHLEARRWFLDQARQAGFEVHVDGAGNHIIRLLCGQPGAKTLILGSHLDSVPNGGRFDGALGVMCAFEVLQTIVDAGLSLPFDLEAIDLTDEEGAHVSLMGSRALAGKLHAGDLENPHHGPDAFAAALERAGLTREGVLSTQRDPDSLAGYLEVHIEQGPRLISAKIDVGIVSHIVGIHWYHLKFAGRADHSGTTPMAHRRDAAQGACAFALAVRETVIDAFPDCVSNVGKITFEPGAFNVVPAAANLALEFRAPTGEQLQRLERVLLDQAHEQARRFDLKLEVERLEAILPTPMNEQMQGTIQTAAGGLGLTHTSLLSGAGHDAQSFADLCPAGMIFVPSVDGRSHSPLEFSRWQDCVNGANLLLHTVLSLGSV